ncbi:transcriptional regulator, partial [Rhodospirillum rubrum]|nr:transcriptional regulator [Rhodospirillum rubrum]
MTPMRHSVSDDRLLAYAAGALSSPEALVVATHLWMRPQAGAFARRLE